MTPEPDPLTCPDRFAPPATGGAAIPICSSRPLGTADADVRRLIVVIHGDSRNAPDYFRYASAAATAAAVDDALIVAPQFLTGSDIAERNLDGDLLRWSAEGWKEGNLSQGGTKSDRVSSFAVIDGLLGDILGSGQFPNIADVVVVGHSAGGQFANRYAAGSVVGTEGTPVRFIVANPSSYLYLGPERFDASRDEYRIPSHANCSGYDRYKYGLEDRNQYMAASSTAEIVARYASRTVAYALGALDTDPRGESLDTSCEARIQGPNRLERGRRFVGDLTFLFGSGIGRRHQLVEVPGVGHDGEAMLTSPLVRPLLFPSL